MKLGIYRPEGLLDASVMAHAEKELECRVEVLSFYRAWNRCEIDDDLQWLAGLAASRKDILLTWEPWRLPTDLTTPHRQPDFSLNEILSGRYEAYIRAFARALRQFASRLYLRPMHEMNGFWYPWCGTVNGNSPCQFICAWQYLREMFEKEDATDIRWVWSPYASSFPPDVGNRIETYFPGDRQIDRAALDGYNWGSTQAWSSWQSFEEIFTAGYDLLSGLSVRPLMIAETACAEQGGRKNAWIKDALAALGCRFPRVEALVWFDVDKECDWRIASSRSSRQAFRKNAKNCFTQFTPD